jgi:8-oxo-dGTP pyrophosphatase MutT (NUDIX family)
MAPRCRAATSDVYHRRMQSRQRVVVYVERDDALLVFDHCDHPEVGTQVPAGGIESGESMIEAAIREVQEETGVRITHDLTLLGTHQHLDGLGRPALSHFFRTDAPKSSPMAWQHVVVGNGGDAGMVFECRFDPAPRLGPDQAVFRRQLGREEDEIRAG